MPLLALNWHKVSDRYAADALAVLHTILGTIFTKIYLARCKMRIYYALSPYQRLAGALVFHK